MPDSGSKAKKSARTGKLNLNRRNSDSETQAGTLLEPRDLYENGGKKSYLQRQWEFSVFSVFFPTVPARGGNFWGANPVTEVDVSLIASAVGSPLYSLR